MSEMPGATQFHDALAHRWRDLYASGGFQKRLKFTRTRLAEIVEPGQTWLDAGCGSGLLTDELAALGATGYAVDASKTMIEEAVKSHGLGASRFQFQIIETVENLEYASGSFDGVLCSSVIEYLDRPLDAFREFHRVLRPNGALLISVANRYSPIRITQTILHELMKKIRFEVYDYISFSRIDFGRTLIKERLEEAGFVVERIDGFDPVIPEGLWRLVSTSLLFVTAKRKAEDQP